MSGERSVKCSRGHLLLQQYVLRLKIAMYKPCFVEKAQCVEQLLGEHSNKSSTEAAELVLLDKLVKIHTQQLKDKTQMLAVDEGVFQA